MMSWLYEVFEHLLILNNEALDAVLHMLIKANIMGIIFPIIASTLPSQ